MKPFFFLVVFLSFLSQMVCANANALLKNQSLEKALHTQTIEVGKQVKFNAQISGQGRTPFEPIVISQKGASYIKVNFSEFALPKGSYITVSNPSGTEVYRYGDKVSASRTLGANYRDGKKGFSAMSISGNTALVKFIGSDKPWQDGIHKVTIDSFYQGFSEAEVELHKKNSVDVYSTCGVNERRDVMCWADTNPVEFERTRPVARILRGGRNLCTAWRVGSTNLLFTNNHCVSTQSGIEDLEVWFNYQNTTCGGEELAPTTKVAGAQLIKTDYRLDYTLFTVDDFEAIRGFGHFGLDIREPQLDERIYIVQHGAGNPKELAIESDRNADGLCRIDDAIANGRGQNTDTGYYCDTIGGSSGSPVLAASSNNAIALHHFGGCTNQGVRMDLIWPQVATYFDNVIPVGDSGGDPVQSPKADFNVEISELVASFQNSSSDSDGTIVEYLWDFGDGNSSSNVNPIHTYAVGGNYTVSLTVTDNDGLKGIKTKEITVRSQVTSPPLVVTGISGSRRGEIDTFEYEVTEGSSQLNISLRGNNGDADLYVRFGQAPTFGSDGRYDCRKVSNGSNENCTITNPRAGTYFIVVRTWNRFNNLTLRAELE